MSTVHESDGQRPGEVDQQVRARRDASDEACAPAGPHEPHGPPAAVLYLQRTAGNAAVASALQRMRGDGHRTRPGDRLPPSVRAARRVLGPMAAAVRVHPAGRSGPAVPPGALATTSGADIALAADAPSLASPAGELLLAHEAAHVVQQTAAGTSSEGGLSSEDQADQAAVAAMAGRAIPPLGRARGPQHFEAPRHQASLTHAMDQVGFSDAEQREAYFGNWCRDVSQALVPTLDGTIGSQATMTLVSALAQMKFGRPVTPGRLGMYDPVEHMDNPAGQINADLLQNQLGGDLQAGVPTDIGLAGRGSFTTPQRDLGAENIAALMAVDDAGVPAYVAQSREYVKDQVREALRAGRTAEGLSHVGNFSHVVEDLFAHSNWIEIAFGQLVRDGSYRAQLSPDAQQDVEDRVRLGQPPIETYAADVNARGREARPALMTGTFSPGAAGHDTLISIKAEVQNLLAGVQPFEPGGSNEKWWDFGLELLQNVEAAADEGNLGVIFADHIRQIVDNMGIGEAITSTTRGLERGARETFGEGIAGDVATGVAGLVHGATTEVVETAGDAWDTVVLDAMRSGADVLGARMDLVKVAYYVKHGGEEIEQAWGVVKDAVTGLPAAIRDRLLPLLSQAEESFKEQLRELLNTAFRKAVETLVDAVDQAPALLDVAESPVYRKAAELEEQLGESGELRQALVNAIGEVAPGPAGDAMIARVRGTPPTQLAALANSPELTSLLAQLAEADRGYVLAALDPVRDASERLAQFENLPEWAKHGGSHSQMAKDHADSPFFGAAFMMANAADRMLLDLLRQAWSDLGSKGPAPGLEHDFRTAEELEEPEGEQLDAVIDTDAMDRQRERDFLETRQTADRILETGHADELPSAQLLALADRLGALAEAARAEAQRFPVARELAERIEGLIAILRQHPSGRLVEATCDQVRDWITDHLDDLVSAGMRTVADGVAALLDQVEHLVAGLGEPEEHEEHAEHDPGQRTEAHYDEQIEKLDSGRGTVRLEEGRLRAPAPSELDRRVDAAGSAEQRLFAEIDRIINHPYETTWWHGPLQAWAQQHTREVSQWILDRNAGRAHSH